MNTPALLQKNLKSSEDQDLTFAEQIKDFFYSNRQNHKIVVFILRFSKRLTARFCILQNPSNETGGWK